ncbi:MAG: hypothetical protein AAGU75_16900 [Bacillota bacterium]
MIKQEHLTPEKILALKEGTLSKEAMILALKHIGECEQCADRFAESYHETELMELPPDFKADIFASIDRDRISYTAKKKENRNRKRELYFYSFKVSIAACVTLALFFSGTFNYGMNFSRTIQANLPEVNVITENLKGFSDKLIDFEVTKNSKEEQ